MDRPALHGLRARLVLRGTNKGNLELNPERTGARRGASRALTGRLSSCSNPADGAEPRWRTYGPGKTCNTAGAPFY